MKRITLWSIGLMLAGVALWWGTQVPVGAAVDSHIHSGTNYIGFPGDGISDETSERSGWDRLDDRHPDGDSAGSANDQTNDLTPDCGPGAGDGTGVSNGCGTPTGTGDLTPTRASGAGDRTTDSAPDAVSAAGFDRPGDNRFDYQPSRGGTGDASDRVGSRDCVDETCDRVATLPEDFFTDNTPDHYDVGPADQTPEPLGGRADEGGFGLAGIAAAESSGCSLVASQAPITGSGIAYLIMLLAPVAAVVTRRRIRRS